MVIYIARKGGRAALGSFWPANENPSPVLKSALGALKPKPKGRVRKGKRQPPR